MNPDGASLLQRKAETIGIVQLGKEKFRVT